MLHHTKLFGCNKKIFYKNNVTPIVMSSEVRELRKRMGLSQDKMADLLAISRSKLALVECGKRRLNEPTENLLRELKKTVADGPTMLLETQSGIDNIRKKVLDKMHKELVSNECKLIKLRLSVASSKNKLEKIKKGLALICEEMKIFSGVPIYFARLQKMHQLILKSYALHSPERIEYIEIQIQSLKVYTEQLRAYLDANSH